MKPFGLSWHKTNTSSAQIYLELISASKPLHLPIRKINDFFAEAVCEFSHLCMMQFRTSESLAGRLKKQAKLVSIQIWHRVNSTTFMNKVATDTQAASFLRSWLSAQAFESQMGSETILTSINMHNLCCSIQ